MLPAMGRDRRYSDDEVRAILGRAVERDHVDGDALGHEDLVAVAKELGVSPDAVEEAVADLAAEREVGSALVLRQSRRRRRFWRGLSTYALVNAFLVGVDIVTGGGTWWYWPAMGWGLFVALSGVRAFFPDDEKDRRSAERAVRKRQKKRAAKARRQAKKTSEKELEEAVSRGVTSLVGAVARKMEDAAHAIDSAGKEAPKVDSEFGAYIDRAKRADAGVGAPTGVRVGEHASSEPAAPLQQEVAAAERRAAKKERSK